MELAMVILPLMFAGFTSYRLYRKRINTEKRAMNKWINKDFHDVINISLNTIARTRFSAQSRDAWNPYNYHVHYRTLIEKDAKSIVNDDEGIALLTSTIQKCVENNEEIMRIDGLHKNDRNAHWTICSAIMNQISNLCSYGYIYRDLLLYDGLKQSKDKDYHILDVDDDELGTVSCDYVMAITCEAKKYKVSKTNKIRVILLNKSILQTIIDDYKKHINSDISAISDEVWMLNLENVYENDMFRDWNKKRWLLIKKIAEVYDKQFKINNKLDWGNPLADLELVVVKNEHQMLEKHL